MTSHDPHNDDERDLAALYRSLPHAGPDTALDDAVLGEASRAVLPVVRRRSRWPVALATAATVVLAAGLAWRMRQEVPVAPSPAPAVKTVPADAPVAIPAEPTIAAKVADTEVESAKPSLRQARVAPKIIPQVSASRTVSSQRADSYAMPAPAQALAPAPPPAPPAPPAPAPAPMMEAAPAPAAGYTNATDGPEQRIEEIRRRLRAGDRDGAERAFGAMRERYPDYPLPDDLRPLLR
jgi:hypothetical protein